MEPKYEKYNKVYNRINNKTKLFANVFLKKGNKNTSENIFKKVLAEFKKKRFEQICPYESMNQSSSIVLREALKEITPTIKSISIPFKKRRKYVVINKKWRKKIKGKKRKRRKNYHFLFYSLAGAVKNGSRLLRKNTKIKRVSEELLKTLSGKSNCLNIRKEIYKEIQKITFEAKM
uniref:ribosomal protein S7 n=1 Tax=Paralagenidium karlingii TaxID=1440115 RepID=UPI0026E47D1D|nr:ribosomal protein S7 [Paralagenidium karlingii]WJH17909.1 ribosomal protein S7 [Paralagenidium karlingii]